MQRTSDEDGLEEFKRLSGFAKARSTSEKIRLHNLFNDLVDEFSLLLRDGVDSSMKNEATDPEIKLVPWLSLLPTKQEVDTHSRELAQLILSNWISVLRHTCQDREVKAMSLTEECLPEGVQLSSIFCGSLAFCLDESALEHKFDEFKSILGKKSQPIELSHNLFVTKSSQGWVLEIK